MVGFQAALESIRKIEGQVGRTAARVAALSPAVRSEAGDTVSLSEEMVSLIEARIHLGATTAFIRTGAEMEQHILDVLG